MTTASRAARLTAIFLTAGLLFFAWFLLSGCASKGDPLSKVRIEDISYDR